MSEHDHSYRINFNYEQIECVRYQHGCSVMLDEDEAERRINEFPALEAEVDRANGVISMLEHHWINPMEYYEAEEEWRKRVEGLEESKRVAIKIIALARSLADQPTWIKRLEEVIAGESDE